MEYRLKMRCRRLFLAGALVALAGTAGLGMVGNPAMGAEAQARSDDSVYPLKVGIVDLRRAFSESHSVKNAKNDLIQERNEVIRVMKERQRELQRLYDEIQNQRALLSEPVRIKKEEELRSMRRSLERLKSDSEQELNRQFLSISELFLADARKELVQLGRDSGYTLIMDVNNELVLYGSETVDLTDQLIERLNDHR